MMRRRQFITLLGGTAATWPLGAHAQERERVRRVGVLTAMSETDPTLPPRMAAFQKGLQAFGWAEGRNVSIVYRNSRILFDHSQTATRPRISLFDFPMAIRCHFLLSHCLPI